MSVRRHITKRVWGRNIGNFAKTLKRKRALSRLIIEDRKKRISYSFSAQKNTKYWPATGIFSKKGTTSSPP